MGFRDWVGNFLWTDNRLSLKDCSIFELHTKIHYREIAINTAINLIANALVRSKFYTYEKGKRVFKNNYYLFNVAPNMNQNSTEFNHRLVSDLVNNNEVLVVMIDDQMFIADSFVKKEFALRENIYTDVQIGELKLTKSFIESEVLFYKLNNSKMREIIDSLYADYGKLIAASTRSYLRGNAIRGIVDVETTGALTDDQQKARENLFTVQFKNFLEAEGGSILPLTKGLTYTEVKSNSGNGATSRDVRAIIDDMFDIVATALHIPKGLLKGDLADVSGQVDAFLMFCINPIAELINDENNRKIYTKEEYLERTYLRVDTTMVKYVDPTSIATALDKLLSSGTTTIDENRTSIGLEPTNEPWAQEHFITKNYQEIKNYLEVNSISARGGDNE